MPITSVRALAASLLLLPVLACSNDTTGGDAGSSPDTTASSPTAASSSPAPTASAADGACAYPSTGRDPAREVSPPPADPQQSGTVTVRLETTFGTLPMTLDAESAPCTVSSFLSLARQDYFDDSACHRLTTQGIFVLQCGDPTGTGRGGPGYSFEDELSGEETYPAGTVAMANSGPDTNGSQFFVVYEDSPLGPSYTVFGELGPAALDRVQQLADQGTQSGSADGSPAGEAVIEDVVLPG